MCGEGNVNSQVATLFRIQLPYKATQDQMHQQIIEACESDDAVFVDVIDAYLHRSKPLRIDASGLRSILDDSGSAYTLTPDGGGLQRRVGEAAGAAAERAMSAPGVAAEELRLAWAQAFHVHPNPSYAWNHAIKAVEAVLIPLVVPKQDRPHLGHVLGTLDRQGDHFQLVLLPEQGMTSIETLVAMLRLMYPNPDRHTGPEHRIPTLAEAQAVVHLAVTVVEWARDGVIRRVDEVEEAAS